MNGNGETNKPTINWVTRTLCCLGILLGGSIPLLAYLDKPISSEHNTIAGIVIGGLLSMLTKSTPTTSVPVQVPTATKSSGEVTLPEQTLETKNA